MEHRCVSPVLGFSLGYARYQTFGNTAHRLGSLSAEKDVCSRGLCTTGVCAALLWNPFAGCSTRDVELPNKNSGASWRDHRRLGVNSRGRACMGCRLTSGIYMHVKLCSFGLEGAIEDSSEGRCGPSETCSLLTRRRFSLTKEHPVPASSHPRFSSSMAGGGRRSDDEFTMPFRCIRFSDRDSAEHVTTILGSAWPSSTASFSSSSSMWTMSSGSPLAGTRKLQWRPSASHIPGRRSSPRMRAHVTG